MRDTLKLVLFAVFLCIITPYACPSFPFLPLLPISIALATGIKGERTIDGILCGLIYAIYFAIISIPIASIWFFIPYHWCLLTAYSILFFVYNRDLLGINDEKLSDALWFRLWLQFFFNPPLLIAFNVVAYFGGQLSAPLCTIIDDNICVGALPTSTGNVLKLYGDPYHIRAVVNLCDESQGPMKEYEKYNMQYVQINTLDTTPPKTGNIALGIKFIEKFMKWKNEENNGLGRVFIHCKGGRARSVTMAVCWLLSQGMDATTAIKLIESKRAVAHRGVLNYDAVKHFIKVYGEKYQQNQS